MLVVTTETIAHKEIVYSFEAIIAEVVMDVGFGFKIVEKLEASKKEALDQLVKKAESLNANAIVDLKYTISSLSQVSAIVIVASGTAVKTQ